MKREGKTERKKKEKGREGKRGKKERKKKERREGTGKEKGEKRILAGQHLGKWIKGNINHKIRITKHYNYSQ